MVLNNNSLMNGHKTSFYLTSKSFPTHHSTKVQIPDNKSSDAKAPFSVPAEISVGFPLLTPAPFPPLVPQAFPPTAPLDFRPGPPSLSFKS